MPAWPRNSRPPPWAKTRSEFKKWLNDPQKLLELIAAAQGSRGGGGDRTRHGNRRFALQVSPTARREAVAGESAEAPWVGPDLACGIGRLWVEASGGKHRRHLPWWPYPAGAGGGGVLGSGGSFLEVALDLALALGVAGESEAGHPGPAGASRRWSRTWLRRRKWRRRGGVEVDLGAETGKAADRVKMKSTESWAR